MMRAKTRVPPALRSVLAAAVTATIVLASMGPAEAQKRGRHAHHRAPHRSRLAGSAARDDRPRSLGLLQHARGAAHHRRRRCRSGPPLATGYEVMSPTKVRFKLRPGVKFHDGTPVQRGRGEVHLRPRARGHPARALGQPRRLAERGRGGRRPHGGRHHPRAVRTDPPHARHVLHGHRVAHRGAEDGRGLQPRPRGHRAVQVRGVEDQHPRDPRAESRTTGATRRCSTA